MYRTVQLGSLLTLKVGLGWTKLSRGLVLSPVQKNEGGAELSCWWPSSRMKAPIPPWAHLMMNSLAIKASQARYKPDHNLEDNRGLWGPTLTPITKAFSLELFETWRLPNYDQLCRRPSDRLCQPVLPKQVMTPDLYLWNHAQFMHYTCPIWGTPLLPP